MREIKFRVWDTHRKAVYHAQGIRFEKGGVLALWGTPGEKCLVEGAVSIMQYIGAKDKNGVEIYEGDIIRSPAGKDYWIRWSELTYRFVAEPIPANRLEAQLVSRTISNYEVVGNIHESPEFANWEGTKID